MCRMSTSGDDTQRAELYTWLAGRLNREEVPPPLRNWLENDGHIEDVLDDNQPLSRTELLDLARERLRFVREMTPYVEPKAGDPTNSQAPPHVQKQKNRRRISREAPIYDPMLDPLAEAAEQALASGGAFVGPEYADILSDLLGRQNEKRRAAAAAAENPVTQRAEAFSLYLAKLAEQDPEVQNFRQAVFGEAEPNVEASADTFLSSPATALFPASWFTDNGVPIVYHEAEVLTLERVSRSPRRIRGEAKVSWVDDSIIGAFEGSTLASDPLDRGSVGAERLSALKGSAVSDLLDVDEHLRERFPWVPMHQDPLQVPTFILTGRRPWVDPIYATVPEGYSDLYQTVDISVWPWVPTEEVTAIYERIRNELNPTPTTSSRRLALLCFIMSHPEVKVGSEGEKPTVSFWREHLERWNSRYPEGSDWYYSDVRNFRRDFNEAFEQVTNFYRSDTWSTPGTGLDWDDF